MGEVESEIGDVSITRRIFGPEITVTGNAPPAPASSWWPWLIGAAVLGGLWYITREAPTRPKGRAGR